MYSDLDPKNVDGTRSSGVFDQPSYKIDNHEVKPSDKTSQRSGGNFLWKMIVRIFEFVFPTPEQSRARSIRKAEKQVDDSFVSMMKGLGGSFNDRRTARHIATMHDGLRKIHGTDTVSDEQLERAMKDRLKLVDEKLLGKVVARGKKFDSMSSAMQLRIGADMSGSSISNRNAEKMFGDDVKGGDHDFNPYEGVGDVQQRIEQTLQVLREILGIPL